MKNDNGSTGTDSLNALRNIVAEFVAEREWQQFHSPKNVSMAMTIEAAELMEHFQWLDIDQSKAIKNDATKLAEVAEELADVFCYCLAFANEMEIDLVAAFLRKMEKNRRKYPAIQFKGKF